MVGPGVVAPKRLADPLAVGVAAAALGAAHALVVQHGVDVHGALLALQASLSGDTQSRESTEGPPLKIEDPWTQQEEGLGPVCVHIVGSLERGLSSLPGPFSICTLNWHCHDNNNKDNGLDSYSAFLATLNPLFLHTGGDELNVCRSCPGANLRQTASLTTSQHSRTFVRDNVG